MKRGDTYGCESDGRIHCAAKKKPGTDAGAVGGAGTRFREDGLKMGERLRATGYRQSGTIGGSS